ncbi:MAG: alpha-amylase family protein, partial [Planctomycetota bacterium]
MPEDLKLLFNHDGWCVFMQSSPYQDTGRPVGLEQVHGYVDEVADAGCDALMFSPVLSKLPMWHSEVCPHWRQQEGSPPQEEATKVDVCYNRLKAFIDAGGDIVQLSADRARAKGIAFFVSWRMNEGHDVRRDGSPLQSPFWRDHPELRIGGGGARTLWGRAMSFAHAEVRDYQFALIRELCTRYSVDGLELDFLRFEKFFPRTMPREERFGIMRGLVERVRRMLDEEAGGVPLCARVQSRPELVAEMGLDLPACVRDGLIQMVNVAPFIVTQPDAEIEEFRALLPAARLYGEITHCTHYGRLIETGFFEERKI